MSRPNTSFAGVGATKNTGLWPYIQSCQNKEGVFYGTNLNIKNRPFAPGSVAGVSIENR